MTFIEALSLVLLAALLVPVVSVILDAPLFRRHRNQPEENPVSAMPERAEATALAEMTRRVTVLEDELDDLSRTVRELRDETDFLRNLLDRPRNLEH